MPPASASKASPRTRAIKTLETAADLIGGVTTGWGDRAEALEKAMTRVLAVMPEVGEEEGEMIAVDNGSAPAAMLSAEAHLRASSDMMAKAAAALEKAGNAAANKDVRDALGELQDHLTLRDLWNRMAQLKMEERSAADSVAQAKEEAVAVVRANFRDQAARTRADEAIRKAQATQAAAAKAYEAAVAKLQAAKLDPANAESGYVFPRPPPAAQVGMPVSAASAATHPPAEPSKQDQRYDDVQKGKRAKTDVPPQPPSAEAAAAAAAAAAERERTVLKGKFDLLCKKVRGFGDIAEYMFKDDGPGSSEVNETLDSLQDVLKKLTSDPHNVSLTELTKNVNESVTEELSKINQSWDVLAGQD